VISTLDDLSYFGDMKRVPKEIYYIGNKELLKRPKVSIVGSRKALLYTKDSVKEIANELAKRGVVVVSGAAMGVDLMAHIGAGVENTIAVMGNGLDIRYPAVNERVIEAIENEGLVISSFPISQKPTNWSFVVRNEIVVALGEVLIVAEADIKSGSMHSVEYAKKMKKSIYVLPHRLGQSSGTQKLLANKEAKAIYNIEEFANRFGKPLPKSIELDEFYIFCQKRPTLNEAVAIYGERVYEEELEGNIVIENGIVKMA